jgi:hypothetical protein
VVSSGRSCDGGREEGDGAVTTRRKFLGGTAGALAGIAFVGCEAGTDTPYPWTKTVVETVMATPGLSDVDRVAILGGSAAKLLRLEA